MLFFWQKLLNFPKSENIPLSVPLPSVVDATLFGPLPDLQSDQRQASSVSRRRNDAGRPSSLRAVMLQ